MYQIEKNNSKIVSLEKIENVSNLWGSSREDREYREVALIAVNGMLKVLSRVATKKFLALIFCLKITLNIIIF